MPVIAPTITEDTPAAAQKRLKKLASFAPRVHLDLSDGIFSPRKLAKITDIDVPADIQIDLHLMLERPQEVLESVLIKSAYTTIFHVESKANTLELIRITHESNLRAGLALLPKSQPDDFKRLIELSDYVLVFGGHLGYQGGDIDLMQINKIARIKQINPQAEIGWDGGVNDVNIVQLLQAGVHVLNVGGFIAGARKPQEAYATLNAIANPEY